MLILTELLIWALIKEIEPYASRCGEDALDWYHETHCKVFLEPRAPEYFDGILEMIEELAYWCVPESVEAPSRQR